MEIPIQRGPQHHRYLSRGARGGFEIIAGRIRDGGYEEIVVVHSRQLEGMDMAFFLLRHPTDFNMFPAVVGKIVLIAVILRLYDNGPSSWPDIVVKIQLNRLEKITTENRNNRQVLSIGQTHNTGCRSHAPLP
jgi:hypothetical protein